MTVRSRRKLEYLKFGFTDQAAHVLGAVASAMAFQHAVVLGELREQIALPLIAKLAISAHSEASVRSFCCACMSFMDGPCEETSYPRERLLTLESSA